jgi:hypothetical protein
MGSDKEAYNSFGISELKSGKLIKNPFRDIDGGKIT